MFELVIANGLVYDGRGEEPQHCDIGIVGERIEAVGDLSAAAAEQTIDAFGLCVTPGFIDIHNHASNEMDGGILTIPMAANLVRQGITTLVTGNCGGSPWPIGEHLDAAAACEIRQNYATLLGYHTIRSQVVPDHSPASAEQLRTIRDRVKQGMDQGAIGASSGLTNPADPAEMAYTLQPLKQKDGVYASHIRDEGEGSPAAVDEMLEVGRLSGLSLQISHLKTLGPYAWDKLDQLFSLIESARAQGINVECDRYPYTAAFSGLAKLTLEWRRRHPRCSLEEGWQSDKAQLRQSISEAVARVGGTDRILLAPLEPMSDIEGRTLQQLADEWQIDPAEVVVRLTVRGGVSCIWMAMLEENLVRILARPYVMVASDGHLRVFGKGVSHPRNYGTFPRVLGRYVREENVLQPAEAVRKMTSMPGAKFGIKDRGVLAAGYYADVVVFNPETIADHATFSDNHHWCTGVEYVIVNGGVAVDKGQPTARGYGRVLR